MALETVGDNYLLRTAGKKKPSLPPSITHIFSNIGHSPIETSLWTLSDKIEANVLPCGPPFQFEYMGMEVWANHVG